jgi:hypothetical protein
MFFNFKKFKKILAIILMFSMQHLYGLHAAEYFVATNGSDAATGADWANSLLTISNAVAKATTAGDVITVSNGTYNVTTQINLTAASITVRSFKDGVYGGITNAQSTIVNVSGGVGNRRCFNITTASIVDGFTAKGALRASGTMLGGGFYITNGTVQNCIAFTNNGDTMYGCGAYMDGGKLLNSLIYANGGSDRIRGAGVYIATPSAIVSNCIITANTVGAVTFGGGVYMTAGLLISSTISSNNANGSSSSSSAGIHITGGSIRNCVIYKNVASNLTTRVTGGGVHITGGTLESSTITENITYGTYSIGAGVYFTGGAVTNCIIHNNRNILANRDDNYFGLTSANTSYTLTQPALGGLGNTSLDQGFRNPTSSDYRLQPGPAMDTGTNLAWMAGATDRDGNLRTNGISGRVDMGAYEYVPGVLQCGFAADAENVLVSSNVVFRAYSGGTNTTITGYVWDLGNGTTISGPTLNIVTNAYTTSGVHTISLQITNSLLEVCTTTNLNYLTAWPSTVYVWTNSPSSAKPFTNWATASRNINDAVNDAPDGTTIIATNGTYVEAGTVTLERRLNVVSFGGGLSGASNTIIKQLQPQIAVTSINNTNAILDGFTIRDGAGTTFFGRGVTLANGTVRNCIVRNNVGDNINGKGILMTGGLVSNCIITANNIGAGGGDGAGIHATGGMIINCDIFGNIGAARLGAGVYLGAATIRNCLIRGNTPSGNGGGIHLNTGGKVENCTITSNTASSANGGGGIFRASGTAGTISNCIVYGNTATTANSNLYTTTTTGIGYICTTNPVVAGTGCISSDPLFVSTTDLSLQSTSPCKDTGSNQSWMTDATDFRGNNRIINSIVDMGAYEYVLSILPSAIIDNIVVPYYKNELYLINELWK